jgi:CubicO group peptidase (beta-lactamase class C family)
MKCLILVFILFVYIPSNAQVNEFAKIDSLFSMWSKIENPGGAVGIIKAGKLIYSKGYGSADLEHDIPISSNSLFFLGSVAKQFTAFCILLLEEEGKLRLEDEIQKFLPDFPRYESPITINHLIHHTSGIRDLFSLFFLHGRNYLDHISEKEAYDMLKKQSALNFKSGERQSYSNSNYFLLGKIIKVASGKSLKNFAQENIFTPLGMRNTFYLDDNQQIVRNRVESYIKMEGKEEFGNQIRRYDLVGSAGIYSTIEDLFLWDQNFYHNKLGKASQSIIDKMYDESTLNNGQRTGYAFGLGVNYINGIKRITHTGGHAGYRAILTRFPEQNFSFVLLTNRSDGNIEDLAAKITNIYVNNSSNNSANDLSITEKEKIIRLKNEELLKYTGFYLNQEDLSVCESFIKNDTLCLSVSGGKPFKLLPIGNGEFIRNKSNGNIAYATFKNNNILAFTLRNREFSVFKKYVPKKYTPQELAKFTGIYFNPEINGTIQLIMDGVELKVLLNGEKIESSCTSLAENMLIHESTGTVFNFKIDKLKKINGFTFLTSNVKNLFYTKQ